MKDQDTNQPWSQTDAEGSAESLRVAYERVAAQLQERETLIRVQRDLAVALNAATEAEEALVACLEAVVRTTGFDCGAVYLVGEDEGLVMVAQRGLTEAFARDVASFGPGSPQAQDVLAGQPLYTHCHQLPSNRQMKSIEEGLRALVVYPICHEGRAVACLTPASRTMDVIPDWTRDMLETLSAQMGAAVDRILAQQALRESEQRMRVSLAGSGVGLWDWDLTGRQMALIPHWAELLGYEPDEVSSEPRRWLELIHPDDLASAQAAIQAPLEGRTSVCEILHRLRAKSGQWRWLLVRGKVVRHDSRGKPLRIAGMYVDVTERKQAEDALRLRSEAVANMPGGVVVVCARDGVILYTNPRFDQMFGYPPGELLGRSVALLNAPNETETPDDVARQIMAALRRDGIWRGELRNRRKDGTPFWSQVTVSTLESSQFGTVWVGVHDDITQRKETEEALQREQRRLRQLLDLHERDRQLIAYEIHDGLTQKVVGAKLHLDAFREHPGAPAAGEALEAARRLLHEGIADARTLINGVRPPVLDDAGLVAAIEHLVEEFRKSGGPEIQFFPEDDLPRLAAPLECSVFRIVQESLTNARRHSRSEIVRVRLMERDGLLRVEIRDWGVGFEPDGVPADRFGLEGIRERAQMFGGQATIDSVPGQGTRILVELPLLGPDAV